MKKTTTPLKTPSPIARKSVIENAGGTETNPRMEFVSAALTMSWQLAIVVLVPIIGGFELDKKLHILPLLTIVGFILAMIGMGIVVWRQMQIYSPIAQTHNKGHRS